MSSNKQAALRHNQLKWTFVMTASWRCAFFMAHLHCWHVDVTAKLLN